jgi:hypothetical protein
LLLAPLRRHLHSSKHSIPLLLLARGHLDAQRAERAGLVAHALQQLVALGAQYRRGSGGSGSGRRQRWLWRRCCSHCRCRTCVALRARTTLCRLRVQVPPRSSRHRRWQISPLSPLLVLQRRPAPFALPRRWPLRWPFHSRRLALQRATTTAATRCRPRRC